MLGLMLREEFKSRRLEGTAIEFSNRERTGAIQIAASAHLAITYPTFDVLQAIEATGPGTGKPVVLIGERGLGKSHLLAALHHALTSPEETRRWLAEWSERLADPRPASLRLRSGMHVISESLHRQSFKFLWDLLFERHPHGEYVRGMWDSQGARKTDMPGSDLLLELFRKQPTALILDEYQTWFDGLSNSKQIPARAWAFNFVQILTDIAREHPDLLVLVVSVRNGESDAFQQIARMNPQLIDFKGPRKRVDRLRLLLHRLFTNRLQVAAPSIETLITAHVDTHLRIAGIAPADQERVRREFVEAWPFSPTLMTLLEDEVLKATQAQETRDLIKVLAAVYKSRGEVSPLITPADFLLDDTKSGVAALLDSVSNLQYQTLREKAQRNLSAVRDAVTVPKEDVPHLEEIVASLWLRSLALRNAGATRAELQVDLTRGKPLDVNGFGVELQRIIENSFNIHEEGERLVFREEENPQAKLFANARNQRLFEGGEDLKRLAREVRYVIGGSDEAIPLFRVVVLAADWENDPFRGLDERDLPDHWDERIPLLVLPEAPSGDLQATLGKWLRNRLGSRRNAVRFLVPRDGSPNLFYEPPLKFLARAIHLADAWKAQSPEYRKLQQKHERQLRDVLAKRFDRFAIVESWSFQEPERSTFRVESHRVEGSAIPEEVHKLVARDLFVAEDFSELVRQAAKESKSVGGFLRELQEPRPGGARSIAWLGEAAMKEKLLWCCARGEVAVDLRGMELLQADPGEEADATYRRIRGKLGSGRHLDESPMRLPQASPRAEGMVGTNAAPNANPTASPDSPRPVGYVIPSDEQRLIDRAIAPAPTGPATGNSGDLFQGPRPLRPLSSVTATSALNLMGKVESWGIRTGTRVQDVQIRVGVMTGAQLNDLLKKLPDGVTYELTLNKEES